MLISQPYEEKPGKKTSNFHHSTPSSSSFDKTPELTVLKREKGF